MTRTPRLLLGAFTVAVTLAVANAAGAAEKLSPPQVSVEAGQSVITMQATSTGETFTPKGGTATSATPTATPSTGDGFSFASDLRQGEMLVGRDKVACTITAKGAARCKGTFTFTDGRIEAGGENPIESNSKYSFDILSGTGAYAGATGTGTVQQVDDKRSNLVLRYTTAKPAAPAETNATGEPKVTTSGDQWTIKVRVAQESASHTDAAGKAFTPDATRTPQAGDVYASTERLLQGGDQVGSAKVRCTQVKGVTHNCAVTYGFAKGTIDVAGPIDFGEKMTQAQAPIVGGTGSYAGATGTVAVTFNANNTSDDTLTFTTTKGQVAAVPDGGTATGGGPAPSASDSALLIGLGLAVVAGSAAVLALARPARRRI